METAKQVLEALNLQQQSGKDVWETILESIDYEELERDLSVALSNAKRAPGSNHETMAKKYIAEYKRRRST